MEKMAGLTSSLATQLLTQYGQNEIAGKPQQSTFQIFLSQFTSILIILLIAASVTSIFLGELLDGVFILGIVILNGILGFVQEYKAEKTIATLKNMTVSFVRVIRDSIEQKVDSKLIVPGDIVILEEGDKIPADGKLIKSLHLEVNESSLTGESMPVEKNSHDQNKNLVYLGTVVSKGRAIMIVTQTGMQTRFGQIAKTLTQIKEEITPLQQKLNTLGKQLSILAVVASGTVFLIGIFSKHPLVELILANVSLAIASVPEGLPAVITITLAVGMQRMAREKAILRKLSSIEALGSATIIATDKTGTLTKNEMQVTKIWLDGKNYLSHDKSLELYHGNFSKLLTAGVVCNNASLIYKHDHGKYGILGDSTEGALLLLAQDRGLVIDQVKQNGKLLEEFAFDPALKMMTIVWESNQQRIVYTKGAPEFILDKCILDDQTRQNIYSAFREFAASGLRIIALATKTVTQTPKNREEAENDLTFLGFVGISDPPREEVKEAIMLAESAGIKTIMITGDNELTANAIGTKIGLIKQNEEIITGEQFDALSDDEAIRQLTNIRIFARTTPDQKLRIVQLLQKMGHVVAVTGDGVNDALALKQADIGVAMGITGTDVAKESADMIIADDNYATLVTAVGEGRVIFDNIKSAVKYLVGCNLGEVLAVVIGMLLGWPLVLTPLQLLYINLVTDGLPAIVLAITPKHAGIMNRKPRLGKNIFSNLDGLWFFEVSLLTTVTTLLAFWWGQKTGNLALARALAFTTIIFVQHFILLDIWSRNRSILKTNWFTNKILLLAFWGPLVIQLLIIYTPSMAFLFKITQIPVAQLVSIIILSSILLLSSEIRKLGLRKQERISPAY